MHANEFSADVVGKAIFHNMISDFRRLHGQDFAKGASQAFGQGIKEFRVYEWPKLGFMSPARFKAWWQLRHLFKTHRFAVDLYTDEELEARTNQSYRDFQASVRFPEINNPVVSRVLREARKIAKEILGPFEPEQLLSHAKFGKRSSIGCSFKDAYIDCKLTVPSAFTSTAQARRWFFEDYLPHDPVMRRIVKKLFRTKKKSEAAFNFACTSLKLVNVPKSWKTHRSITPLSLLELFYTFAVGGMVTDRLKDAGLDITRLQDRHKVLARLGSSGELKIATGDLERASDSILSVLLNAVLARDWYNALKPAFCRQVVCGGEVMATHTVLPMGNGFTFPVETLVFYCLTKAIGNLTRIGGTYSVYGDDCIYPTKLHPYVAQVFPRLGLSLNMEKSYADSFFRESCGGDYYRGCDVRPYVYKADTSVMARTRYLCHLYKVYNGLKSRWAEEELPSTFRWLLSEITHYGGRVLQVPPSYPDYSGVRTDSIMPATWLVPWQQPTSAAGTHKGFCEQGVFATQAFVFQHLRMRPKNRVVLETQPYYWLAYRGLNDLDDSPYHQIQDPIDPHVSALWVKDLAIWCKKQGVHRKRLESHLKAFARSPAVCSASSRAMLDYVREKGRRDPYPVVASRGDNLVTRVSSVVTHWT